MPQGVEPFLLGYGVLGAMFLLMMFGIVRPKWDSDAKDKTIEVQRGVIENLTEANRLMANNYDRLLTGRKREEPL